MGKEMQQIHDSIAQISWAQSLLRLQFNTIMATTLPCSKMQLSCQDLTYLVVL